MRIAGENWMRIAGENWMRIVDENCRGISENLIYYCMRIGWELSNIFAWVNIFILDLTSGFKGFGKDSRKTPRESFKCWDLVCLILEAWRYVLCLLRFRAASLSALVTCGVRWMCCLCAHYWWPRTRNAHNTEDSWLSRWPWAGEQLTHCPLGIWLWFWMCINFEMWCSDYIHEHSCNSTLVHDQVMAWCHQTTYYLNQYWPRSLSI